MRFFMSGAPPSHTASSEATARESGDGSTATVSDPELSTTRGSDHRLLEVMTPLNVIVGFSSMLADVGHDLSPEVRHRYATRPRRRRYAPDDDGWARPCPRREAARSR